MIQTLLVNVTGKQTIELFIYYIFIYPSKNKAGAVKCVFLIRGQDTLVNWAINETCG